MFRVTTILLLMFRLISSKSVEITLTYHTKWPNENYTPMFSSEGVLFNDNQSLLSNMLQESVVNMTFLQMTADNDFDSKDII